MTKILPIIRFAKKEDLSEIVNLCKLHAQYEKAKYQSANKESLLEKYIFSENPTVYCLVVEKDEKLVGYATYMKQFSTWDAGHYIYMDCLFLTEEWRGFGIGEELINRIKKEGENMGCDLIQWQTPDFNERAIKFYKRIGAVLKSDVCHFIYKIL